MTEAILREVVALSGFALQAEDCLIRAAIHHRGEHGGLVRLENERYYQFIVWKAVLPKWHAEVERNYRDMVITSDGMTYHFEMKNWKTETTEILKSDIIKLSLIPNGGYLLVFSCNPKGSTEANLEMVRSLPGIGSLHSCHPFSTENKQGELYEFWIAGWHVLPAAPSA